MTINAAALFFLLAAIIFAVAIFVMPPRHSLIAAGLVATAVGLFCQATGLGA